MAGYVTIPCPNCLRDLRIRPEHVGQKVACKFCANLFRVPTHAPIPCPKCNQQGMVRTENLGRMIRCKACSHVFRAHARDTLGRSQADLEVKRLQGELDRRTAELAKLQKDLDEARGEVVSLDERARTLTDERDSIQHTQEWSVADEGTDAAESCSDLANGTEPDLPMADPSDVPDEAASRIPWPNEEEPTKTRLATEDVGELGALREERNRLREELDALRESAERTVVTQGKTETLERDLELARADNVRLVAERDEIGRAVDGLMKLLRERDAALTELGHGRSIAKSQREQLEAARLTLATELEAVGKARSEAESALAQAREQHEAERRSLAEKVEHLTRDHANIEAARGEALVSRDAAESIRQALSTEAERLRTELAETRAAQDEALAQVRANADAVARLAVVEAENVEAKATITAMEADRAIDRAELERQRHRIEEVETLVLALRCHADTCAAEIADLTGRLKQAEAGRDDLAVR